MKRVADKKKPVYLFWNRKWVISTDFGSGARAYAYVEDIFWQKQQQQQQQNLQFEFQPPCEPYPHVWWVREKKDKTGEADADGEVKHKLSLPMRVLDIGLAEPTAHEILPVATHAASQGSGSSKKKRAEKPLEKSARPKDEKRKLDKVKKEKKDLARRNNGDVTKKDDDALTMLLPGNNASKEEGDNASKEEGNNASKEEGDSASKEKENHASQKEEEDASQQEVPGPPSSSEEESDDDTSSTSSSSSLSAVQAQPRPEPKPEAPVAASPPPKHLAAQKMKEDIKKKVREELTKDTTKFWKLRALMIQRVSTVEHWNSLTAEDVGEILDEVGSEFNISVRPPAESALEKKATTGQPETEVDAINPCRGVQPKKSALRQPGAPRQRVRNISYLQDAEMIRQTVISSFRFYDSLWYKQPGALVECDRCSVEVPQMMGSLQGAPGSSQFAQNHFFCAGCMGGMGSM